MIPGRIPVVLLLAALAGCGQEPLGRTETKTAPVTPLQCGAEGFVSTVLAGAVNASIDWGTAELSCEGMPRPDGAGARLRFAGQVADRGLTFIIALPTLEQGSTGESLTSKVTLIEEGSGRFFSTADKGICWTDITSLEPTAPAASRYAIGGTLYCVAPLAQVNGGASVSLAELDFLGLLDWDAS